LDELAGTRQCSFPTLLRQKYRQVSLDLSGKQR
jgi:hypothetical protein